MKKTMKLWLMIPVLAVIVLSGCGPTAHIEKDKQVNFSQYKTFAWAKEQNRRSRNDMMERNIKSAISQELKKTKGWREDNHNPDVLLSYDVLVERNSKTEQDPVYRNGFYRTFYNPYRGRFYNVYYPSQFMGYNRYSVPVREGTITITMVDANTEQTVMQGWATEEIDNRNISSNEIDRIVHAIFKKFDVATK